MGHATTHTPEHEPHGYVPCGKEATMREQAQREAHRLRRRTREVKLTDRDCSIRRHFLLFGCLALLGVLLAAFQARAETWEWSAATGPVSGYEVHASWDGADWELLAKTPETNLLVGADPGRAISLLVRAFDAADNVGPWSEASEVYIFPGGEPPTMPPPPAVIRLGTPGRITIVVE